MVELAEPLFELNKGQEGDNPDKKKESAGPVMVNGVPVEAC